METKPETKPSAVRKIVTALLVIIVLVTLFLIAQYLVSSVDIVELLKKLHGG